MSPLVKNHHWMLVMKIFALIFWILQHNHGFVETSYSRHNDLLVISAKTITDKMLFPSAVVYHNASEINACFNILPNGSDAGCCRDFNCGAKVNQFNREQLNLTVDIETLSSHDVVVLLNPTNNFSCMPSAFYNSTGLILNLHNCLKTGGKNIRVSQDGLCGLNVSNEIQTCEETGQTNVQFEINIEAKTCKILPCYHTTTVQTTITMPTLTLNYSMSRVNQEEAAKIMSDLDSLPEKMGNSNKAAIKIGNITGVIAKLSPQILTALHFRLAASWDENGNNETSFYTDILIPIEASEKAVNRNGSYAGVLLFPGIYQNDPSGFFFNNAIVGIDLGAKISNLSETIDIYFSNVNTSGRIASCMSWDGQVNSSWITDGCKTVKINGSIMCRCNHLTFFAILMSPAPANISASVYNALSQITEAGCGVSMFFLGSALFMHFLMRKTKATNAAKILVNLFIAMFALNFCFSINKTIADLNNPAGCVAMAAFLHYSMLATFTWFSMQALHLYFSLRKLPAGTKHYMYKIYATGWVTPAAVIIPLLALNKYGNIVIYIDDGSSEIMCWIPDSNVHIGVNIGYYAIVFLFTFSIFAVTVVKIVNVGSKAANVKDSGSTKKKFFSILGLFCLLGISWGFAFFSFGSLLIPSYYIFTILNSFQGFLLFIYYYYSTKITPEASKAQQTTSSPATVLENIYVASPCEMTSPSTLKHPSSPKNQKQMDSSRK